MICGNAPVVLLLLFVAFTFFAYGLEMIGDDAPYWILLLRFNSKRNRSILIVGYYGPAFTCFDAPLLTLLSLDWHFSDVKNVAIISNNIILLLILIILF